MARHPHRRRRPSPPPPLSTFGRLVAVIKRNPLKSITAALAILASIVPAMKGIQYLDDVTDDWQLARHVYVSGRVDTVAKKAATLGEQNQNILRDLQIDTANGKLAATKNDIKKWQLELEKPDLDQTLKGFIQQQIDSLTVTKDKLDAQLHTLTEIKTNK